MAFKHKITQELDKRGIKTKFFCELYNIKLMSFHQTISGARADRKCIKVLYKEGMLDLLLEEFPPLSVRHFKQIELSQTLNFLTTQCKNTF